MSGASQAQRCRERPLGLELDKISLELHRLTNRIGKARADDRFTRNMQKDFPAVLRFELRRAVQDFQDVLDVISEFTEPTTTEETT